MQLQLIQKKTYEIRGQKVMLDFDLASLYRIESKRLKESVRRNLDRFPEDFMFELSEKEIENLRTQFATSSWGGRRYKPFAFTEQGVAMLSSILKSKIAIEVNSSIMRTFVLTRQYLSNYKTLKKQIADLEKKMNRKFKDVYEALNFLLQKDNLENIQKERKRIGFK